MTIHPKLIALWWSGFDVRYLAGRALASERQIQSSTGIDIFWWSFDSDIRESACLSGMRRSESDHSMFAANM
jgi:hypothetical protein